jgi:hypothetical protein
MARERNDWTEQDRDRDHSYGNAHDYARSGSYPGSEAYSSDDYAQAGMQFREGSGGGSGAGYGGSSGADVGRQGNRGFWEREVDERSVARQRDPEDGGHRGKGPRDYARSDARIEEDVHEMLANDPWLDASEISVDVAAREVTLTGTVGDRQQKRRAEDLVHGVSGVTHVQNNIRVQSPTLERTAREAQENSDNTPETTALEDTASGQKSSIGAAARFR